MLTISLFLVSARQSELVHSHLLKNLSTDLHSFNHVTRFRTAAGLIPWNNVTDKSAAEVWPDLDTLSVKTVPNISANSSYSRIEESEFYNIIFSSFDKCTVF